MQLIETKTLAVDTASISFTSIPQDGTDLFVFLSLRSTPTADPAGSYYIIAINGGGTSTSTRYLQGTGSSVASATLANLAGIASANSGTSNTFANDSVYIPNYTSSNAKSYSVDSVTENNATGAYQILVAGLWNVTSAITSLAFTTSAGNFMIGSTVSLYKITKGSDGIVTTS